MLTVLVTGGAGFLGTALIRRIAEKANVIVIDSLDRQVHQREAFPEGVAARARCVRADLCDPQSYASEVADVDVIVHLGAQTGTGQSMYELSRYTSSNAGGTAALLEAVSLNATHPQRIILASSRAVYGDGVYRSSHGLRAATRRLNDLHAGRWDPVGLDGETVDILPMQAGQPTEPTSIYGLTKLWQEQLVKAYCTARQLQYTTLRFQNVFGPGQPASNPYTGIMSYMMSRISAGEEVELFEDGLMTRDFLFVDDAAQILESAICRSDIVDETLDAGSGRRTNLIEMAEMIGAITGRSPNTKISGRFRQGDVRHAVADRTALESAFPSLSTTPLRVGLEKYLEWFAGQPVEGLERHEQALLQLESHGLFHSSIIPASAS